MRTPLALLVLALVLLAGCAAESRTAARYVGTLGGEPVDVVEASATSTAAGLDLAAAVRASVAALRGDVCELAAAVRATPPPAPPVPPADLAAAVWQAAPAPAPAPAAAPAPDSPWPVLGAGLAGLLAAAGPAVLKAREAARHRADADEAWGRLLPPPAARPAAP